MEAIPRDVSIADVEDEGAGFASLGVMVNFPECFSILKEYGYDFNRLGADGMSVLHFVATNPATSYDRVAMARALIQCGADPSLPGRDETMDQLLGAGHYTPTLCAETALRVARGRTPALLKGRDPDRDIAEAEALLRYLRAAAENYRPAPKTLAEALKVSVVDSRKVADEISVSLSLNSLYHAILSRSEMEVLFHLNALKSKRNLSEIVLGGHSLAALCVLANFPEGLELLKERDYDFNVYSPRSGYSALHHAVARGGDFDHLAMTKQLLEYGADPNLRASNEGDPSNKSVTPTYIAHLNFLAYASGEIPVDEDGKNLEEAQAIAEQLREHGGDVNLFPDKGEPLLITTCREYTAQNRSWMIAFGADPTIAAANGDTTVEIAAAVISQHAFGLHPGFTYFDLFGKLKEMAGQGNVRAQGMLGYAYLTGVGTDQAPMEGARLLRAAANADDAFAQTTLGLFALDGAGVIEKDPAQAVRWLSRAAEQGNPKAQALYGVILLNGEIVPQNVQEGLMWTRKAAEQGQKEAQGLLRNLGLD